MTLKEMIDNNTPLVVKEDSPSIEVFCDFMKKYKKRDIELNVMVINPKREDFRVEIFGLTIDNENANVPLWIYQNFHMLTVVRCLYRLFHIFNLRRIR